MIWWLWNKLRPVICLVWRHEWYHFCLNMYALTKGERCMRCGRTRVVNMGAKK